MLHGDRIVWKDLPGSLLLQPYLANACRMCSPCSCELSFWNHRDYLREKCLFLSIRKNFQGCFFFFWVFIQTALIHSYAFHCHAAMPDSSLNLWCFYTCSYRASMFFFPYEDNFIFRHGCCYKKEGSQVRYFNTVLILVQCRSMCLRLVLFVSWWQSTEFSLIQLKHEGNVVIHSDRVFTFVDGIERFDQNHYKYFVSSVPEMPNS